MGPGFESLTAYETEKETSPFFVFIHPPPLRERPTGIHLVINNINVRTLCIRIISTERDCIALRHYTHWGSSHKAGFSSFCVDHISWITDGCMPVRVSFTCETLLSQTHFTSKQKKSATTQLQIWHKKSFAVQKRTTKLREYKIWVLLPFVIHRLSKATRRRGPPLDNLKLTRFFV